MQRPELDDLRAYWNAYASIFEEAIESSTVLVAHTLIAHLRLGEARAAIDAGTGPGAAALAMHERLPRGARLVATDLAPSMVARARARLPAEIEVAEANIEELPYDDGAFDRLLCNLTLMLTADPDRALAEAHRVLCPGGMAAWSVWGRPELSHMFTIPPQAAQRAGIELPPQRSNFHLGSRDALRERVARNGFTRVIAWYQAMMPHWRDSRHFADVTLAMPRWRGAVEGRPPALMQAFRTELMRLADERLDAGEPLGLDTLIVIAERP